MSTINSLRPRAREAAASHPPAARMAGRLLGTERAFAVLCASLVLVGLAVAVAGVSIGPVGIPPRTIWSVVGDELGLIEARLTPLQQQIVWEIRVPRAMLGMVTGAGLAVCGVVVQAVVRNPLGDPYLLGIAPGASLGAVIVIVAGSSAVGGLGLAGAAFLGAVASFCLTLAFARQRSGWSPTRLVLAGVAVGYALTSATYFLQVLATPAQVQRVLFWQLGSVAGGRWSNIAVPTGAVVAGTAALLVLARRIDALALGRSTAGNLGIDVARLQLLLVVLASVITGCLVATAGGIGFVGLIVPHVARLLVGATHRRVLVTSALLGGPFLVLVDIAARMVRQPAEIPIGIVTAAIGAPTFLVLLRRQRPTSTQGAD